jgi:RNA polymerase sigma-70 factor (ECF subfamily)
MDANFSTEHLLSQARNREPGAVDLLLERHRQRLKRMVAARMDERLVARVDPSDVVQETLASAARRLDGYLATPNVAFYVWLRQMGWETLIQFHRRHLYAERRTVRREESLEPGLSQTSLRVLADDVARAALSPSGQAVRRELNDQIRAAILELPPRDHEILTLLYLEHLSLTETAEVLGIAPRAATMRHLRALQRLRGIIEPLLEDD